MKITNFHTQSLKTAKRICILAHIVRKCQINELALLVQRTGTSHPENWHFSLFGYGKQVLYLTKTNQTINVQSALHLTSVNNLQIQQASR